MPGSLNPRELRIAGRTRGSSFDVTVTRSYYPNGAIKTDSLAIRSLTGLDFTTYRYGLTYGYNLSGQVTSMQHPTNLAASGQDWNAYAYNPVTGALSAMTDRRGNYFEFHHNYAGRMTSLRGPFYSDSMRYDREGRLVRRVETAAIAGVLHDDSLVYDARVKLREVIATSGGNQTIAQQWYSGSGMLVGTDWVMNAARAQQAYGMDALGNVLWSRSGDGGYDPDAVVNHNHYQPGLARLQSIEQEHLAPGSTGSETTTRTYDVAGNLHWGMLVLESDDGFSTVTTRDKRSRSYYGADQRLRYFQERDVRFSPAPLGGGVDADYTGVWEEYRYDPLGRRVLVNTRTKDQCTTGDAFQCASATTRMVWAGDQLLWEIRQASQSPGEEAGPSDAYGTVSYTHAGGIDRPLVITKGSTSILTHQNWRGQFSSGTNTSGARSDCLNGATTGCHPVNWPGWRTSPWHADAQQPDIRVWWGGLVDGMRDASGQMYMRNRYYDPGTGQFTQPDPIGLAGGLNSYGFAAGDPVSYSDPYGLCAAHLVQKPTGDNPEAVCPGGLTHGEYYVWEDGASTTNWAQERYRAATAYQRDAWIGCHVRDILIRERGLQVTMGKMWPRIYMDRVRWQVSLERIDRGFGHYAGRLYGAGPANLIIPARGLVDCNTGDGAFHADSEWANPNTISQ